MGQLTTHILDTMHGKPAAGVRVELYSLDAERRHIKTVATNSDGRCDAPLLDSDEIKQGNWEIAFHIGEYFKNEKIDALDTPFLTEVPVRFGIDDVDAHYHVPLLVSPWSYTTYRGS
ncbi:MAG: hydroxyisourate hydrolase [Gammaproteobacteria bacterium]|nr:hydroxyisourate hydrolase [Gammaproteobacteria bacterium]